MRATESRQGRLKLVEQRVSLFVDIHMLNAHVHHRQELVLQTSSAPRPFVLSTVSLSLLLVGLPQLCCGCALCAFEEQADRLFTNDLLLRGRGPGQVGVPGGGEGGGEGGREAGGLRARRWKGGEMEMPRARDRQGGRGRG
jgi:hypothetical protein